MNRNGQWTNSITATWSATFFLLKTYANSGLAPPFFDTAPPYGGLSHQPRNRRPMEQCPTYWLDCCISGWSQTRNGQAVVNGVSEQSSVVTGEWIAERWWMIAEAPPISPMPPLLLLPLSSFPSHPLVTGAIQKRASMTSRWRQWRQDDKCDSAVRRWIVSSGRGHVSALAAWVRWHPLQLRSAQLSTRYHRSTDSRSSQLRYYIYTHVQQRNSKTRTEIRNLCNGRFYDWDNGMITSLICTQVMSPDKKTLVYTSVHDRMLLTTLNVSQQRNSYWWAVDWKTTMQTSTKGTTGNATSCLIAL